MLVADELDGEGFLHVGRGAGKGDGTAENLVAALEDLQIVLAGKLLDFVDAGGIGSVRSCEVAVGKGLASMLGEVQSLTVLQDHRDFDDLMRRSWSDGTRSRHWGVLGALQRNFLQSCHGVHSS
jgi:hypothetical protein